MTTFDRDDLVSWGKIIFGFVAIALVVGFFFWAVHKSLDQHKAWVQWCHDQSGYVHDKTETHVGTGINPSNGQPVTTTSTSTTYYCLSEDGRILDIR